MTTIDRSRPYFQHDVDGEVWLVAEGANRFQWVITDFSGEPIEHDDTVPFVWPGPFRAWPVAPRDDYLVTTTE